MGRWYVGMVLSVVSIVLLFLMMFYPLLQPWWEYKVTTTYTTGKEYQYTLHYGLQEGYITTNYPNIDFDGDNQSDEKSPPYPYNTPVNATSNPYAQEFAMDGDAKKGGRPTLLSTWNNIYYMIIIVIVLTLVAIALYPVAGYRKIGTGAPKALTIIASIILIAAAFYAVFAVPYAINEDYTTYEKEVWRQSHNGTLIGYKHSAPNGSDFYWGGVEYTFQDNPQYLKENANWGAGLGWYLAVVVFVLLLMASAYVYPSPERRAEEETKACPMCGGNLRWVPHRGFYCVRCMRYYNEDLSPVVEVPPPPPSPPPPPEPVVEKRVVMNKERKKPSDEDELEW